MLIRIAANLRNVLNNSSTFYVSCKFAATAAKIDLPAYKLHRLAKGPEVKAEITKEDALNYYAEMNEIRKMEYICSNLYKDKVIRGFCHLCIGQEACCTGIKAALRPKDLVITAYRDHGWAFVMGLSSYSVIAELAGKVSGCARAKGGSMHMYAPGFFGGNGIVGGQVPLGTGLALACKYVNNGAVSITVYGDGAANQGQVFEVFNMAKLWSLPVVYVCENNGYGMGTSTKRAAAVDLFYTRGDYVPGILVDGMDVLAVREATKFAIEYCLAGSGPILLEVATYRYSGHSMSDPGTSYRSREEVQNVREQRDPINSFKNKMLKTGMLKEEDFQKIDVALKDHFNKAVAKILTDPEPETQELSADIYHDCLEPKIRGVLAFNSHKHIKVNETLKKAVP